MSWLGPENGASCNFCEVTLGDVVLPRREKVLPTDFPELPFLGLEHVEAHSMRILGTVKSSEMNSSCGRFYAGDVLYSRLRPYLNKVVHPDFDGICSAEFIVIPRAPGIENKFMAHRINSPDFVEFASSLNAGDRPRVDFGQISSFKMSLPSSLSQKRIVAKLEELLSDLDAGDAELKAAQAKLGQYRQSMLKAAVDGSLLGVTFGNARTLGELVTTIGQGWSPKCEGEASDDDSVWAVIKTTAIQPLHFDGFHNKVLPTQLEPRKHLEIKTGDLLVTRAGPRSRVGIACLAKMVRQKLILCDKAYRLRLNEALILPEYAELFLNAPQIVNRIDELKTGISDSGLNLTQDRFLALAIPLPTLNQQRRILDQIEQMMIEIRGQEVGVEQLLSQSTAQRKNILKAAFSGQLVPQDPKDEPASVLLERIRAERAASPRKGVKPGRKAK